MSVSRLLGVRFARTRSAKGTQSAQVNQGRQGQEVVAAIHQMGKFKQRERVFGYAAIKAIRNADVDDELHLDYDKFEMLCQVHRHRQINTAHKK